MHFLILALVLMVEPAFAQIAKTAEVTQTLSSSIITYVEVKVSTSSGAALTYGRFLSTDEKLLWDQSPANQDLIRKKIYSFALAKLEAQENQSLDVLSPVNVSGVKKEADFDTAANKATISAAIAVQDAIISDKNSTALEISNAQAEIKKLKTLLP